MTNEEKAKKIVDSIFSSGFNTNRTFYEMAYNATMKMAKWKDKKFDAILLCVKYSFEKQNIKGADEFIAEMKKHWEK